MTTKIYTRLLTSAISDRTCIVRSIENDNAARFAISAGESAARMYPNEELEVEAHFDPDHPGLATPTLLSNHHGLLILESDAARVLVEELDLGECEMFAFSLFNHKRRRVTKQYVFFNPLGSHAITHPGSEFSRFAESGNIYSCRRWVLDRGATARLPDLVRASELPRSYFASTRLVSLAHERGYTNFHFEDVEHR